MSKKALLMILDGWDPETGSGLGYGGRPVMRHFTIGLELTLK